MSRSWRAWFAWPMVMAALLALPSGLLAEKSSQSASDEPKEKTEQAAQTEPAADEKEAKAEDEPLIYVATSGDTFAGIAERFDTTVEAIMALNDYPTGTIAEPGLVVSVPVGKKRWPDAEPENLQGESFVKEALRYQGVPYRRAGTTSRGLDCSGLVYRVLRAHGIPAPRTAATLYGIGFSVEKKDLRAGDLVFFNTSSKRRVSHVGIYVGEGKFIHASSGRHRVTISTLESGYYAKRYLGARRLKPHDQSEAPAQKPEK